jgi:multiple sugar transport system permease protein
MLPLLRANFVVILVWRAIDTFRIFDVVYSLTAGGPARSTETLSIFAYRNGFQVFELGFAAAISLFMVVFMIVVSFGLLRFVGRGDEAIY